jgi:ribonuclease E
MSKEMVISATPHETRVAIMEEGQLCEIYVEREKEFALVGSIYKGKVYPRASRHAVVLRRDRPR